MAKSILTGGTEWIVRNLVGNLHVGEPLHVAMATVLKARFRSKARASRHGGEQRTVLAHAAWYARQVHRENRAEYRAVGC